MRWLLKWVGDYDFKPVAEAGWAALITALVYAGTVAATWDPDSFTEWRTLVPALAGGAGRAALGAFIARIKLLFA